jgi:hypothetical protein
MPILLSLALAGSAIGQELRPLRGRGFEPIATEAVDRVEQVRQRSSEILQERTAVRQTGFHQPPAAPPDEYFFKVETEPPTRQRLFQLHSEIHVFREIYDEFRLRSPDQVFLLPAPVDRFDLMDRPNLGPMWFQNRVTGTLVDTFGRRGEMEVANRTGQFRPGAKPEAAVMSETVGAKDVLVRAEIALGSPDSQFGVLLRASDPNTPEVVDQIQANSFYYVVLTADSVVVGKREKGKDTRLAQKSGLPALAKFNLTVTAYEDELIVYRDQKELLRVKDATLTGEFAGLYGVSAQGKPTSFDNFFAIRFGGPFAERAYAAAASIFPGPNVHYRPLYFEQAHLERYGHHLGNWFQPALAHSTFFAHIALAPYSVGKSLPWECHSGEGYHLPGEIVLPFKVPTPVWDARGGLFQSVATIVPFAAFP